MTLSAGQWRLLHLAGLAALVAFGVALVLGIGWNVSERPIIALLVALAVLLFGMTLMDSAVVPLLCTLPALLTLRVAVGGVDLTYSDAALAVAFIPAVLFTERPFSAPMRAMVWFAVLYQVSIVFTVVANPYRANLIEWFHSGLLTAGALIVGWSIGREGHARLGLTLLLLGATFLGAATTVQGLMQYANGDFAAVYPTWPYGMHKNAVGCILGIAAAMAFARPSWTRWPALFAQACFWICVAGILVVQSRQALTALAVALVVIVLRTQGASQERRSKIILLAVGPALAVIVSSGEKSDRDRKRVQLLLPARRLVSRVDPHLADRPALRRRAAVVVHRPLPRPVPAAERDPGVADHRRPGRPGRLRGVHGRQPRRPVAAGPEVRRPGAGGGAQPARPGPAGPLLGRRPDVGPLPDRRHLSGCPRPRGR